MHNSKTTITMVATITDSNGTDRMKLVFDGEDLKETEDAFELMKYTLQLISSQPKVLTINITIS